MDSSTTGRKARPSSIAIDKGETVCTEGEFGSTAYYIVSGTVDISINNPLAHLRTKPGWGLFGRSVARMKSFLDRRWPGQARGGARAQVHRDRREHRSAHEQADRATRGRRAFRRNDLPHLSAALGHGHHARTVRDGGNAAGDSRHARRQSPGLRRLQGDLESESCPRSRGPHSRRSWRKNIASARSRPISAASRSSRRSATNSSLISRRRLSWSRTTRTRSSARKARRRTPFT